MSKLKVHSGASKRFKKTGNGLKRKKYNNSNVGGHEQSELEPLTSSSNDTNEIGRAHV